MDMELEPPHCEGLNKSIQLTYQECNQTDYDPWPLEKVVSLVVPFFFGMIGLAGLLGNALVVLVVSANPTMRSTTNILIINLAVADLLFVIFCVPFTATDYVLPTWPFGDLWCKFVQYMIVVTCHASVYTLVLMSLDRFLAVVHPVASITVRTEQNALLAIFSTWIIIITTAVPVALSHGELAYPYKGGNYTACVFLEGQGYSHIGFQVSFFLSSYVVPLTLISLLYIGMLARLWKGPPGCRVSAESRRGKKRVTRMVVIVVLAFAVCWLPIQVKFSAKKAKDYIIHNRKFFKKWPVYEVKPLDDKSFGNDKPRQAHSKSRLRLRNDAIPTAFPNLPFYLSKQLSSRENVRLRLGKTEEIKKLRDQAILLINKFIKLVMLYFQIILVLKSIGVYETSHITVAIQITSHVLAYSNSCVNPVLYAFLSENFRKAFRKVVWCGAPLPMIPRGATTKTTRTGNGTSNADIL